jgi:hypothetical protein
MSRDIQDWEVENVFSPLTGHAMVIVTGYLDFGVEEVDKHFTRGG